MPDLDCRRCKRWKGCLNKLVLSIKETLKLLDTLPHSRNKKGMFLCRQGYQIARAVIMFDAVKVMNEPAFWDWLAMTLFPHKPMLRDISPLGALVASSYQHIAFFRSPSALPTRVILAQVELPETILAILRCLVFKATTSGARVIVSLLPSLLMCLFRTLGGAIKPRVSLWYGYKRRTTNSAVANGHVIIIAQDMRYCPIQAS